jgi:hypothetical protein
VEVVFVLLTVIGGLLAFDVAALGFGVDSRDSIGDDHAR